MEGRVEGVSAASQCSHPARPAPGARGEWAACRAHPSIDANEVHVVGCNVTPAHWPNHCANAICNWVSCDHLPRLWSEACRPGMRAPILTRTDASCRASRPAPRCAGTARPQPPATWGGGIMGRAAGGGPRGRNSYSGYPGCTSTVPPVARRVPVGRVCTWRGGVLSARVLPRHLPRHLTSSLP